MKKVSLVIAAGLLSLASFSQKVYQTKSAQIKFQPITEESGCVNNQVQSLLKTSDGAIAFSALIKGFKFQNSLLEDHFNENYMESTKPNCDKATFKGFITNIKDVNFAKNGTYKINVKGTLTIHGTPKEVNTTGTIEVAGGKVIAKSNFKVKVADYGVKGLYIGQKIAAEQDIFVTSTYE